MEYGITIYCEDSDLKTLVGSKIHEQLRGNQDYIDSRIKSLHLYSVWH